MSIKIKTGQMSTYKDGAMHNIDMIVGDTAENINAIQQKGQEVLESIHEDFTYLTNRVGTVKGNISVLNEKLEILDVVIGEVNGSTLEEFAKECCKKMIGVSDVDTNGIARATWVGHGYFALNYFYRSNGTVTMSAIGTSAPSTYYCVYNNNNGGWVFYEYALKSDLVYTDVAFGSVSVPSKGDAGLYCDIPSGYVPISVVSLDTLVSNGILSAVGMSNGKATTRFYNLAPSAFNVNGQKVRFWFRRI